MFSFCPLPTLVPGCRTFDQVKASDFYSEWLGFPLDWADQPAGAPAYLPVSLADVVLNLAEHMATVALGRGYGG